MEIYQANIEKLKSELALTAKKDRQLSYVRFFIVISAVFAGYQFFANQQLLWISITGLLVFVFLLLVKNHRTVKIRAAFLQQKIDVNKRELHFLQKGDPLVFDGGEEFIQSNHNFSYDLDFFGHHSLFQSLNRAGTQAGKRILANSLLNIPKIDLAKARQVAVKELAANVSWRQSILAWSQLRPDDAESYQGLLKWSRQEPKTLRNFARILQYLLPALFLVCFALYLVLSSGLLGNVSGLLFLLNLAVFASYGKALKQELTATTQIEKTLRNYARMLVEVEGQAFESPLLKAVQQKLLHGDVCASKSIEKLASLFGRMEHVTNIVASPLLNGSLLFHVHVLSGLNRWRAAHASQVEVWLDALGEIEFLSSLGNLSYNHPNFAFPKLNREKKIRFDDLGHPLLSEVQAVTNSVDLSGNRFFILTGSNMSGKSTFLRALGTNMVLGSIGAPVFAKEAEIHPLPVFVSMRLTDNLTDSESFFYAEVKRLKLIMEQLETEPCFILLDEILRGTNSDDKRAGTMEVIKKMAAKQAYGGIATHDLEVCNVTEQFPQVLVNKRFEVQMDEDELFFDYKLRDGICENKSASFIMKKMGVI
ncbi:MAG: DNA mismatch repair protein [Bacteroidota bacterium]